MAGVWIKVEHATADKPEITRAAEMLGISRREALGLFFDFWIWLDNNLSGSCPGVVRNVSRKSLDQSLACPGFAATLEAIGWGEFDEKAWTLHITNAERHNGNTAKSRALDSKRKSEKRREMSGGEPDNSRNREEKRREDITTKSKASTARKRAPARAPETPLPDGFAISERVRLWAAEKGHDHLEQHLEHFIGKAAAKGYRYVDWDEAFMVAIRADWAGINGARGSRGPPADASFRAQAKANMDAITGVSNGRTAAINGTAERVGGGALSADADRLRLEAGLDVGRRATG